MPLLLVGLLFSRFLVYLSGVMIVLPLKAEELGPSSRRTGLVISEFLVRASDEQEPFIEIYHSNPWATPLGGYQLTGDITHTFPAGTMIDGLGFVVVRASDFKGELGESSGELRLLNPAGAVLLDINYESASLWPETTSEEPRSFVLAHPSFGENDPRAWSLSTTVGGSPGAPESDTPGYASIATSASDNPIIINEIMYHPISGDDDDEYIELYNRGDVAVSLDGWAFIDGISFVFDSDIRMVPGGYLVIAKNRERLLDNHPELDGALVLGGFQGQLSNGGERLQLAKPGAAQEGAMLVVDEVAYVDGGAWERWADGGGSSLELIDPHADNTFGGNWAASDETNKSEWTTVEHTGRLDHGKGAAEQLHVLLLGAGEALIDDVEVLPDDGRNVVSNGNFFFGLGGWTFQGTHRQSSLADRGGALHLRACARGDIGSNRIRTNLRQTVPSNRPATIRAQVRWLRGHPEILFRLKGNYLEALGELHLPKNLGTPGGPNSRFIENAGPVIADVRHAPVLPEADEGVTITAFVSDPDEIGHVLLNYRIDPSSEIVSVPMAADGEAGDAYFTATIPGQASRNLVAFTIEAFDLHGEPASSIFPKEAPRREALILFGENDYPGDFATYRLWMTQAVRSEWSRRVKMSNEPLPITFVYNNERVVYGAGSYYSGSAFTSPGYNSPTGTLCGYDVVFPKDNRILGVNKLTLDFPIRDPTAQREQLMYWFADQLGLPNNYRRYVHVFVNGIGNRSRSGWGSGANAIYEDVQQPGRDLIRQWFPKATAGDLYKGDYWQEFNDQGGRLDPSTTNTLTKFLTTDDEYKTARYRWNWRPRATGRSANRFEPLFELIDVMTSRDETYESEVSALVDVPHWMRTFAVNDLAANWDSFGNPGGKNTFHYRPPNQRWQLMSWDFDVGVGVFNNPTNATLFTASDASLKEFQSRESFLRYYWDGLHEATHSFFQGESVRPLLEGKYAALKASGAPVLSPFVRSGQTGHSIPEWIEARRDYLLGEMESFTSRFSISTNFGLNFQSESNVVTLSGKSPLGVFGLAVNGVSHSVHWQNANQWRMEVVLNQEINELHLTGIDARGEPLPDVSDTITITVTSAIDPPHGSVVINEIMYHPPGDAETEFVELHNRSQTTAYDLNGWRINGLGFTFENTTQLPPGGYLLVARSRDIFRETYGASVLPERIYEGSLDNGGETLTLIPAVGSAVDSVIYDDAAPWPLAADGGGVSLQRTANGSSWAISPEGLAPFTPGAMNNVPDEPMMPVLATEIERTSAENVWISIPSQPEFLYQLQMSPTLSPETWLPLGDPVMGTGERLRLRDTIQSNDAKKHYRFQIRTP